MSQSNGINLRKKILFGVVFSIALYAASYWIVRESNTVRYERDGCPVRGCEEVHFPGDGIYMIFAPIYLLDKYTNSETEFILIRFG